MIDRMLRTVLYGARWLLAPMYLFLVLCLLAVVIQAGFKTFDFVQMMFASNNSDKALVFVLGLVDLTLTGSLVVLVIFSGYENFVSRHTGENNRGWPTWMAQIDFTGLKIKLMSSIVVISAVRLLEEMMDLDHATDRQLYWYTGIHLVFVVSTLLFAVSDRLEGHGDAKPPKP